MVRGRYSGAERPVGQPGPCPMAWLVLVAKDLST